MKKTIYTFLLGALLMAGCSDDTLDTTPTDRYPGETFWTNEKNANAALTGCYALLRNSGLYGGDATPLLEETATPNAYNYNDRMDYNEIARGSHTASNSSVINTRWDACYSGIGRCNTLLARIDGITMSDAVKNRMKGEAKFLRALYYSLLATYYKDAPLILAEPDIDQATMPRTPHAEVVAQVVKDLDEAAQVLPAKYSAAADAGRATAGAALALKARVLLFEASPLVNPGGDLAKWQQAADAAKAVMTLAGTGYGLFNNYRELFLPENEGSRESIFDVQFVDLENQTNNFDVLGSQFNDNAPVYELIQAYEMKDGLPQSVSPLYDPAKPYENRDPRFDQTIVYPGAKFQGRIVTPSRFQITGYAIKKYTVYDTATVATEDLIGSNRSETNYMVLRYADVLLMYAEAQNEAVGPDASVYDAVNAIRQRAGLNPYQVPAGKTKEEMREIIRHERRIEFVGEGYYYNDIRRWKTAEIVMNGDIFNYNNKYLATRTFNPARDYWWPVPQVQRDRNPNLGQNDLYGG